MPGSACGQTRGSGERWPGALRTGEALTPYFALAEQMLRPAVAPETYLRVSRDRRESRPLAKSWALREAAKRLPAAPASAPVLVNFERFTNDENHVGATQRPCMVTGHPLGGCAMADDPARGVVNDVGQVFTGASDRGLHKGLYVMDGSVVSTALGVNPLLTIAAVAERSCHHLGIERWCDRVDELM